MKPPHPSTQDVQLADPARLGAPSKHFVNMSRVGWNILTSDDRPPGRGQFDHRGPRTRLHSSTLKVSCVANCANTNCPTAASSSNVQ